MDVPDTCGLLSEVESRITSDFDATALLEELKNGTWSAEQVVIAFCKRAAIAQQLVQPTQNHDVTVVAYQLTRLSDKLLDRDFLRRSN